MHVIEFFVVAMYVSPSEPPIAIIGVPERIFEIHSLSCLVLLLLEVRLFILLCFVYVYLGWKLFGIIDLHKAILTLG